MQEKNTLRIETLKTPIIYFYEAIPVFTGMTSILDLLD